MENKNKLLADLLSIFLLLQLGNSAKAQVVKIGSQIWMKENLQVNCFRNGEKIVEAQSEMEWNKAGKEGIPVWCYYKNYPQNVKIYGKLYNWYAVNDKRGLAPAGFHIPSKTEFEILAKTVSENSNSLKEFGQGKESGTGTNTNGFSALLAGDSNSQAFFDGIGIWGYIWSSTEYYLYASYIFELNWSDNLINFKNRFKTHGYSVRCLKD